jgi:transcriptional regulator with XRE-family HTH domain
MNSFSRNLRFLRRKAGLNQEEISLLFHKKANTVGNWENQKSEPSLSELIRLAEYFRVSPESLLIIDLEEQARRTSAASPETVLAEEYMNPGDLPPAPSPTTEVSPDAFWSILRELRALHEKMDIVLETHRNSTLQMKADKSSH